MASFNKYLSREVIGRSWQQIQKSLISDDGRLKQLFTLKPIDLYDTNTSFDVSGATVKMEIKSYLENILKKRVKSGGMWPFNIGTQEANRYKFNVVVNGKMDYPNIETWVRNNFKNQLYSFHNGRYHLKLRDVKRITQRDKKLVFELDLFGSIKLWFFRIKQKSTLSFELTPLYDHKEYMVRVKDLDYRLTTPNILLKIFDKYYHDEFQKFLEEVIEISIKEDLFTARILAQEEMNRHQKGERHIFNGFLNDLELERINVEKRGLEAVFLAQGNIQLTR
ncbi:MAG: DUF4403 family protein [Bacteroidetes bacterium]|nr:DUF4403 family protein [Bacteroidota bacterium]